MHHGGNPAPPPPTAPGTMLARWGLSTKGKGNMSALCQWQCDLTIRDRDECMAPGVRPRLPGAGVGVVSSTFFLYTWELSARLGAQRPSSLAAKLSQGVSHGSAGVRALQNLRRRQRVPPGGDSGPPGAWAGAGSAVRGLALQEAALGFPESLPKSRIPLLHVCSHGLYCLVYLNIG